MEKNCQSLNDSFLKKSVPKQVFSACEKGPLFSVFSLFWKYAQLCRAVVSKPLNPQRLMGHHWKNNIRSFHLVPWGILCDR